ncbi:hypothetical protein DF143_31915 [Burkholderia cenocepacia]|nr:hypothetical protein DF143_31915 [Burkholderia cenocepacia]RQV35699.1 hypothetical protein DF033_31235 [Burkholderia cenocepacia]
MSIHGRDGADADPVQGCGTCRHTRLAVRGRALGGCAERRTASCGAGRHGSRRRPLEFIIDIALRGSSVFSNT